MNLDEITRETLEAVKKAQTSGWTSGTGVTGIDLSGVVSLIPVYVPLREQLARKGSTEGAKFSQWKALLNVTNQQPSIFTGFDTAGSLVVVDEMDVYSDYLPIAMAGQVTQDAVDIAKGYADAHALEVMNVLNTLMILEDRALGTGAQHYALPAIGTVVLSTGTASNGISGATTGGTIATGASVNVKCAARSGMNYFNGGSGVASANAVVTAGTTTSTNSVGAFVPAVKGAVAYDWYVGSSTSNQVYYTTTIVNTVLITSVPTAGQALPSLVDLYGTAPTAVPTADSSYSANAFNSMLATILGDYTTGGGAIVTPGSGVSSGATWLSMDGAKLAIVGSSVTELDTLNLDIWNTVKLSPTAYMMNAQQASDLSELLLGTYLAPTYLQPDAAGRSNIAGGGYIGSYLNKAAGGKVVRIEVHPSVPPGTIIARTDSVPFPGSNIGNVFEVRTLRDYAEYPYASTRTPSSGPSGPREEFEIRSIETLANRAPVACGVVSNIAPGV